MVDRNKPILPWEAAPAKEADAAASQPGKLSPIEATAAILRHIREAWNYTTAKDDETVKDENGKAEKNDKRPNHENLKMEKQDVFITVPASFDAVARELTVKAAEMAGLPNVTLLEEPQSAFYSWIESADEKWRETIRKGDLVLVCDVGGGTSDFTLINVSEENGELMLERTAVGEHLLVGGDNMDLALAYTVSQRIAPKGKRLDSWQMRGLWHSCRKAKETILTNPTMSEYPVTILGRGKSLIGGTKKTRIARKEVEEAILFGFFPKCESTAKPITPQKTGIKEVGLSYEADPAITRHLAHFLTRHKGEEATPKIPTAVLFNGGVMKPESVRKQVIEVISSWRQPEEAEKTKGAFIREIENQDFELSVARGAAYYGLARRGKGIRIRGGLNKAYYIGVAVSLPSVPGMPIPLKALCVAPFGMEEGTQAILGDQEFVLVVGESVKFDFLSSSVRLDDTIGMIIDDWEEEIEQITTIETTLDGEPGSAVPVFLEIRVTEIGTLEIWCVSRENNTHRWKLEFNVREKKG